MEPNLVLAFLTGLALGAGLAAVALRLTGTLRIRQTALADLVAPLKETLERMGQKVEEAERARGQAYGALAEQLRHGAETQARLENETERLVRALRSPTVRGRGARCSFGASSRSPGWSPTATSSSSNRSRPAARGGGPT